MIALFLKPPWFIFLTSWKGVSITCTTFPICHKDIVYASVLLYRPQDYFLFILHFQNDLAYSRLIRRMLAEWLEGKKGRFTSMVKMIDKLLPFQVRQYTEHIALVVPFARLLLCTYLVLLRTCNAPFPFSLLLGQSLVQCPAGRNDTLFFLAYAQRFVSVFFLLTSIGNSIVPGSQLLPRLSCRIKPGEKIN